MADSFSQLLDSKIEDLKKCQDDKKLETCNECDKLLECSIRDEYVLAVYNNMSKGKSGGFEF